MNDRNHTPAAPDVRPASPSPKVRPRHLDKMAAVYVRQSTPQQVREHRESRERQYALADHAVALGWPRDRVLVIDDDQGRSGRSAASRPGFQKLLTEVTLGHVGLYSVTATCKHLGIDPFSYLREALPGLFALGQKPTAEQLLDWLPDRWLLNRTRASPPAATG